MATIAAPAPDETPDSAAMPDEELVSYLQENAYRAIGQYEGEVAGDQAKALKYYYRRPRGDEREGHSKVVGGSVAIVTDNAVAALLKPFVSSEETVSFEPRGPEDQEQADQATEYVNYVLHNDNDGFLILHDWFKDAVLQKLGVVKCWWEDRTERRPQLIENLDAGEIQQLGDDLVDGPYLDEATGLYSAHVMQHVPDGKVCIENVPPEEYLLSPYARPGRVAPYEAQRTRVARSDLIEMGFDRETVEQLSKYADSHDDQRAQERYADENFDNSNGDAPGDSSRDLIEIYDEYVLIDYDGDGISELRRVIRCEDVILLNEEIEQSPFSRLCPVPMPHKVYGLGLADQTIDLQDVETVLTRQTLDNLYATNNPRPVIPEAAERSDGSTVQDFEDSTPGAPIRTGRDKIDWAVVPFVADKSFPMLQWIDGQIEARTGISKQGQGLDRDAINTAGQITATQAALSEDAKNTRIEMTARIFAETGVKDLFRTILKILVKYQPRERVIRLRNKWVPIDPRSWNADMDMTISVGLGVGNQQKQLEQAQIVLQTMEQVALSPFASLIDPTKAYNALKRLYTAAGIKNVDDFLVEPKEGEQPPPKPDPETIKAQADAMKQQHDQQMAAADLAIKQQTAQGNAVLAQQQAAAKLQIMREEAALQAQLAREKADFEATLATEKMNRDSALAERKLEMEHEQKLKSIDASTNLPENRPGGALDA